MGPEKTDKIPWHIQNKTELISITVTVIGVILASYISCRQVEQVKDQIKQVETQFVSEKVGRPAITSLEFTTYDAVYDSKDTASIRRYYGYSPEIRRKPGQSPYLIAQLSYLVPANGQSVIPEVPVFTISDLNKYLINGGYEEKIKDLLPRQVYTVKVNFKNSGSTELKVSNTKVFIQGSKHDSFYLVQSTKGTEKVPGGWESKFHFQFQIPVEWRLRPFTAKIQIFYTSTYNKKYDSSGSTVKCSPSDLSFIPIDIY